MTACKKMSCIRKQNLNSEDGSNHQKASAPVPSACRLTASPGPSANVALTQNTPQASNTSRNVSQEIKCRGDKNTPPKDTCHAIKRHLSAAWRGANNLWKTNDPYNWQLLKSVAMFTLGFKLFSDLHKHMNMNKTVCY
ncbi:uncharacterized protein LOC128199282 [Bicyclus anynana]|uniref:Uncharacterized protein LOC128199282 n=1 Tax=Bicyclus anynana TaxID=110368 RepID=A0ABM3LYJ4_BICAN|nr:uncharacterized protein LOC128199282 [Bicyclus anynana]